MERVNQWSDQESRSTISYRFFARSGWPGFWRTLCAAFNKWPVTLVRQEISNQPRTKSYFENHLKWKTHDTIVHCYFHILKSTKSRFFPIYKPAILSISETKLFIVYRITTLVRREITVLFVERKAPELKHVDQTAGNDSGAFKQRRSLFRANFDVPALRFHT